MKIHEFTIIASGLDPAADGYEDRLFEAGCDDATFSFQKGVIIAEFHREAETFSAAIASAYEAMLRAGAEVERIEPDHLVSLSEIAERAGLSRMAVSHYTRGERGENFPGPVAKVTSKHPLWDWPEVAEWLFERGTLSREDVVEARIVKEANCYLEGIGVAGDGFAKRLEAVEGD